MLDGDDAWRHGAVSVTEALNERVVVSVVALGDGCRQPQLTSREIQGLTHDHAFTPIVEAT
jgi:hypothetical protein